MIAEKKSCHDASGYSVLRGAKGIVGFKALLLSCAVLLTTGHTPQADKTAEYAYYLLVIGVILQFVSFVKEERTKQEEN